jgi:hypothetical protein
MHTRSHLSTSMCVCAVRTVAPQRGNRLAPALCLDSPAENCEAAWGWRLVSGLDLPADWHRTQGQLAFHSILPDLKAFTGASDLQRARVLVRVARSAPFFPIESRPPFTVSPHPCSQDEKGKTSAFGTWFAGAMAGLIEATLVVTPVETMKTKLIADQVRPALVPGFIQMLSITSCCCLHAWLHPNGVFTGGPGSRAHRFCELHHLLSISLILRAEQNRATQKYRGLIHGITVVVKEEGIAGVYRGLLPTIAKQMGNQSIRFSVYSQLKAVRGRAVRCGQPPAAGQRELPVTLCCSCCTPCVVVPSTASQRR